MGAQLVCLVCRGRVLLSWPNFRCMFAVPHACCLLYVEGHWDPVALSRRQAICRLWPILYNLHSALSKGTVLATSGKALSCIRKRRAALLPAAAQCAHAAAGVVEELMERGDVRLKQWQTFGATKIAIKIPTERELVSWPWPAG